MPIRINLLAEALAEEDFRRRDPVKQAIYVGALLVVLSLAWFSSVWLTYLLSQRTLNQIQGEIHNRTNEFSQVQSNLKKVSEGQRRIDALQKFSEARFFQGNLLNAVQQIHVPNVQLTRLRLEQSYIVTSGSAPQTNSFGVVAARPGSSTERIILTIDAKDFSQNAGDQVNRYKDAMTSQSFFKSNLNQTNGVRLAGTPSALQSSLDGKPFVLFTLECRFSDKTQ